MQRKFFIHTVGILLTLFLFSLISFHQPSFKRGATVFQKRISSLTISVNSPPTFFQPIAVNDSITLSCKFNFESSFSILRKTGKAASPQFCSSSKANLLAKYNSEDVNGARASALFDWSGIAMLWFSDVCV